MAVAVTGGVSETFYRPVLFGVAVTGVRERVLTGRGESKRKCSQKKKEAQGYRSLSPRSSWRRELLQEWNYHTEEACWPHLLTVTVAFPEDNSSADERVPLKDEILHASTASHVFFPSSILQARARTAKQDITSRSGFVSNRLCHRIK